MSPAAALNDLVSIGCLAGELQTPVRTLELAAQTLGIVPALRLNRIAHFDADQVERIAQHVREQRNERP